MKRLKHYCFTSILFMSCFMFVCNPGFADDTCIFGTTADDVQPLIMLLLDNGAEMKQVAYHSDYDPDVDYTPRDGIDNDGINGIDDAGEIDDPGDAEIAWRREVSSAVAADRGKGNGFFHENGYGICTDGSSLVPLDDDMEVESGDCNNATDDKIVAVSTYTHNDDTDTATFTIYKGDGVDNDGDTVIDEAGEAGETWSTLAGTITLAAQANATVFKAEHGFPPGDTGEIIDGADYLMYSKNYLNWLFFSTGAGSYDGTDLPKVSRFYYAKKAILAVAKLTSNQAKFGIRNFAGSTTDGASPVQPLSDVVSTVVEGDPASNTLDPNFVNNINNMGTKENSSLAEGLLNVGGYYDSQEAGVEDAVEYYCQKLFTIIISPGVSSHDEDIPSKTVGDCTLSDHDGDGEDGNIIEDNTNDGVDNDSDGTIDEADERVTYAIPTHVQGTTYLDDVAKWMHENDCVSYVDRTMIVSTYTIGFMGSHASNLFLINTSNNGNGETNLYDTSDPDYGKWHYEAEDPDDLSSELLAAVNDILSETSTFTAPVVPVTRTTSGDKIYMAFFKPGESNFWEGNVTKFGITSANTIEDANLVAATEPNGALKESAVPYWATIDWAADDAPDAPQADNRISYSARNIYTYLGSDPDLADNAFNSANVTAAMLGNPTAVTVNGTAVTGVDKVINYVRGMDVLDEDSNGTTAENRTLMTGDVLHSEPLVVYYNSSTTMVYFGSNDGMLHAVNDSDGTEEWAFIPPDQLPRLKEMIEGSSHQFYVDSSPKAYIYDKDGDGEIEPNAPDLDKVYLVCGERKGGTSYFALDVTTPSLPVFKWRICQYNDAKVGTLELSGVTGTFVDDEALTEVAASGSATVNGTIDGDLLSFDGMTSEFTVDEQVQGTGGATGTIVSIAYDAPPDAEPIVISELGESWSEPVFGLVDNGGTDTKVFFIGGGYSSTNSAGCAVLAINVETGAVVKKFYDDGTNHADMDYSFPSSVTALDVDSNGYVDKIYAGDLGGQMWRFGNFGGLTFPDSNEDISTWTGQRIFVAPTYTVNEEGVDVVYRRKFFYPPAVTFEKGYHLVFAGTGDRENACNRTSLDRIYCIKDTHATDPEFDEVDLVDVTDPTDPLPDINGTDNGWYIQLATGEKVLSEGTVFYKALYTTTFTPNDDICMPGGVGTLYALNHLTGGAVLDFDGDDDTERTVSLGGGIPSKPVMIITTGGQKMFISVGSTNPDASSVGVGAGIVAVDPLSPPANFFLLWWRELFS